MNNYKLLVEDLRNGAIENVHTSRLKLYHDASLDCGAITLHILTSETGIGAQRLHGLQKTEKGLHIEVRWLRLPRLENFIEPLQKIYEDVPDLWRKLLRSKNCFNERLAKVHRELRLSDAH